MVRPFGCALTNLPDAEMRRLLLAASTNLNLAAVTLPEPLTKPQVRAEGNAMVERESRLRQQNHVALTQHLALPASADAHSLLLRDKDKEGGGGGEGSSWWAEHRWLPSLTCSVSARVRGVRGGWAVCDPHRMRRCGCVIYTLQVLFRQRGFVRQRGCV